MIPLIKLVHISEVSASSQHLAFSEFSASVRVRKYCDKCCDAYKCYVSHQSRFIRILHRVFTLAITPFNV